MVDFLTYEVRTRSERLSRLTISLSLMICPVWVNPRARGRQGLTGAPISEIQIFPERKSP